MTEIDLNNNNEFSCLVNTSGESVKAYKLKILSKNGDEIIYNPDEPTKLTVPVKNKKFLTINNINKDVHDIGKSFNNGSDYQWGIRVYNQEPGSSELPNTSVCDGYLVGSTKSVVWSRVPENEDLRNLLNDFFAVPQDPTKARYLLENIDTVFSNYGILVRKQILKLKEDIINGICVSQDQKNERINNIVVDQNNSTLDQVVYDRYIEFKILEGEKNNLIIGAKEDASKKLPLNYPYKQRIKIDWVDKNLGTDEDIMKIETTDEFTYDYADGTSYQIYQCSDEHTVNSFFADPNSNLNVSNYVIIYNTEADARAAREAGEGPSTETPTIIPVFGSRKIVGYSSDTGEVRVNDSFDYAPINGMVYRAFEYNSTTNTYKEVEPSVGNVYTKQNAPYYNVSGTLSNGSVYYSDINCQTQAGTIQSGDSTNFTFMNSGYSSFDSGTKFIPTPESYKLPTQTEYYKDREKTKYAGTIGYVYKMINDTVSSVTNNSVKYYIATPVQNKIAKGTVFYRDTSLATVGGVYGADYTLYDGTSCNVKIDGATYKIATPQKGKISRGTVQFKAQDLSQVSGVYGVDYQLVDQNTAKIYVNGNTYYIRTNAQGEEAGFVKTVKAGTVYYNDTNLTTKGGILTSDKNYTINNTTYSTIVKSDPSESDKYIATPQTGEVVSDTTDVNVKFYSESTFETEVGEVLEYEDVEYNFGNTYYSTIGEDDDMVYIRTPQSGEVDTTVDVKYYLDEIKEGEEIGVIKPYKNVTYTKNNYIYSTSSTSSAEDLQYIATPSSNYVPYNTQYFKDEGLTEQAGYFRNIDIDFHYTDYDYAFFIVNTTTYYCDIPGANNSYITFDTPFYSTNQLDIGGSPAGYITNNVAYSFKKFLTQGGTTTTSCTLTLGENTYYTKVASSGNTGSNYYEATYAGMYTDGETEVKYYQIKIGETIYYVKQSDTESTGISKNYYDSQLIGGNPITDNRFKVLNNRWDLSTKRLFIQPNNNIKTDYANPDEIVFNGGKNDKIRIDINKIEEYNSDTGKYVDITINKLDNTLWLLEGDALQLVESSMPQGMIYPDTTPQSDYAVYTSFMDSLPFNVFYARRTPNIKILFKNLDGDADYNDITEYSVRSGAKYYKSYDAGTGTFSVLSGTTNQRLSCEYLNQDCYIVKIDGIKYYVKPLEDGVINVNRYFSFRDVKFKTLWESADDSLLPQVKYYKYTLYSMDDRLEVEIQQSEDKYNTDLEWTFRGLDGALDSSHSSDKPHPYKIKIEIYDEYDKLYTKEEEFNIFYVTEWGSNPLEVGDGEYNNDLCEENCLNVIINAPTIIGTFDTYYEDLYGTKEEYERMVSVIQEGVTREITTKVYPEELSYKDTIYYTPEHNPVSNKILQIKKNEVLNYNQAYDTDGYLIPYDLPVTMGTYMELLLTEDFITKISPGEDRILFAIAHNTNDTIIKNDPEYPYHLTENFFFKVHSFSPYLYRYTTIVGLCVAGLAIAGKYRLVQDDMAYLASLWKRDYYGNEEMVLNAFVDSMGNRYNYFDMSTQAPSNKSSVNYSLRFALQKNSKYQIFTDWTEVNEDNLDKEKRLVVLQNTTIGQQTKYAGIFEYNSVSMQWVVVEEEEYQFLNNISQFSYHEAGSDCYTYYSVTSATPYYDNPQFTGDIHYTTQDYDVERINNNYIIVVEGANKYVKPENVLSTSFYVDEDFVDNFNLKFLAGELPDDPYIWMDDSMYTIKQQKTKVLASKIMRVYLKIDNTTSEQDINNSQTTNEDVICQITFDQV